MIAVSFVTLVFIQSLPELWGWLQRTLGFGG